MSIETENTFIRAGLNRTATALAAKIRHDSPINQADALLCNIVDHGDLSPASIQYFYGPMEFNDKIDLADAVAKEFFDG
tara:strand:- start:1259 stop:1495 length:237 start_codon:yes stop_codon:yes gene_type:complete